MHDIPDWVRDIGEPVTLEVIRCARCEDAHKVRLWLSDQMPNLTFYVVGISLARCWIVLAIDQPAQELAKDVANDPQGK